MKGDKSKKLKNCKQYIYFRDVDFLGCGCVSSADFLSLG